MNGFWRNSARGQLYAKCCIRNIIFLGNHNINCAYIIFYLPWQKQTTFILLHKLPACNSWSLLIHECFEILIKLENTLLSKLSIEIIYWGCDHYNKCFVADIFVKLWSIATDSFQNQTYLPFYCTTHHLFIETPDTMIVTVVNSYSIVFYWASGFTNNLQ